MLHIVYLHVLYFTWVFLVVCKEHDQIQICSPSKSVQGKIVLDCGFSTALHDTHITV